MSNFSFGDIERELLELGKEVEQLLREYRHLVEENEALRAQCEGLSREKIKLLQKNEQASSRVEVLISRLRGMRELR